MRYAANVQLSIDYSKSTLADQPGSRFADARKTLLTRASNGMLGFWQLPQTTFASHTSTQLTELRLPAGIKQAFVLGTGGSSLGAQAGYQALASLDSLTLHFFDNSDPWRLHRALEQHQPNETIVVVISKSGGTLETLAQWLVVRAWQLAALSSDQADERVIAVSENKPSTLTKMLKNTHATFFEFPENVGGRFSVLSIAGLLPLRLAGVDTQNMLAGADAMRRACENETLEHNPAALLAWLHYQHQHQHQRSVHVLMPYSDRLRLFAQWHVQLWAESLGKARNNDGYLVNTGPTPLVAVGATDQHAQLQLFAEGPHDKLITFIRIEHSERDLTVNNAPSELAHLNGQSLHAILNQQQAAVATALASDARPSLTLSVTELSPRALGALFFLYEAATAYAGELYQINAFDQPGVELAKKLTDASLMSPKGTQKTAVDQEKASKFVIDLEI